MRNKVWLLISLSFIWLSGNSQNFFIDFQQCYGGSNFDGASTIELIENGFVMFCGTYSNNGDVTFNHGGNDYWLVKTDSSGNIDWEMTYGGSDDENKANMQRTYDNGYIMFGHTYSDDGDITGFNGGADYWAVKTDSLGNIEWQKCMGGSFGENAYQIKLTSDSGYICIGYTASSDGDVSGFHGFYDAWVVKLSSEGQIEWNKCYGGSHIDWGQCITTTNDGGYIIGGLTMSTDGDVLCELHSEYNDSWIVKLDSLGNIEWQQCFGGSFSENVIDINQTEDTGYIFIGSTNSNDGDVSGFHGTPGTNFNKDFWVVKLDSIGNIEWQNCLGGSQEEFPHFLELFEDGGYIVGGATQSHDGDVIGNHSNNGYFDMWVIKLSSSGNIEWQKCLGGVADNSARSIAIKSENNLLISGTIDNSNTGDVNCNLHGASDVWVVEIKDTNTIGIVESDKNIVIKVYPNPAKDYVCLEYFLPGDKEDVILSIKNIQGIETTRFSLHDKEGIKVWDIRGVKPGVYFYSLKSSFNVIKRDKIIIMK